MSIEAMKQALEALECLFGIPEQLTGKGGGDVAVWTLGGSYRAQQVIPVLRQAIEQAEKQGHEFVCGECVKCGASIEKQEPVAGKRLELVGHADLGINNIYIFNGYGEEVPEGRTPLYAGYTTPQPQREWVGLTDDERDDIWNRYCDEMGEASINDAPDIARVIEAKLRSKNT